MKKFGISLISAGVFFILCGIALTAYNVLIEHSATSLAWNFVTIASGISILINGFVIFDS